jgi:hypothetical protein
MKYFIDTEFIEGFNKSLFGKRRHFIDLISIGIVAEDGREYYAISNEFDVKDVWDKWQPKRIDVSGDGKNIYPEGYYITKEYWLRDNVLNPIFWDFVYEHKESTIKTGIGDEFNYKNLKKYIEEYGKSNKQISLEIIQFVIDTATDEDLQNNTSPEFYAYYADYDWVLFCSLFGRMIDLPKGFPMYCRDLKQMSDEKIENYSNEDARKSKIDSKYTVEIYNLPISERLAWIKKYIPTYPKQTNEHNALADAKWNYQLYKFLQTL